MKKHKALKIILIVLGALILLVFVGGYAMFASQLKAASSITKLADGLYSMTYEGDYGFDTFLAQGGASSDADMAVYITGFLSHGFWKPETDSIQTLDHGCSTLRVQSPDGHTLFGRNYDWVDCDAMIVNTRPTNGYASVSTCCLDFIGFGDDWKPEGMPNQMMALAAVYVPMDGMNEKGLCVADLMAGDDTVTHQQTDKPDLTTVSAIRLLLDHAANVDEALALLGQYDMNSSIGSAHHFALADASGKAAVVEYIDGKMLVTDTDIVTNHYISECALKDVGSEQSHTRFDSLTAQREQANGVMTADAVRDSMKSVAQFNYPGDYEATQWTLVCDTDALTVDFYLHEQYDSSYKLSAK